MQGGPQFPPGGDWYAAQPGAQPQAPLYAAPYAQPQSQPQPYMPFPGQAPQGQPYPQGYPQAQPYPQGQPAPYAQPQMQPQGQPAPSAQTQAMPVPGVPAPAGASAPQSGPQNPQQAIKGQIQSVARILEQALPGYQLSLSALADLLSAAQTQGIGGLQELFDLIKDAAVHHYISLGALRRAFMGELTPDVMGDSAVAVNYIIAVHKKAKPVFERMLADAPPDLRRILTGLGQGLGATDALLNQAAAAVQSLVGPQIWEIARGRIAEKVPVEAHA